MQYEKGSYIDDYKVSLLLKQSEGVETYRVRDSQGKLCILKNGISKVESDFASKSHLFISANSEYVIYRYINGETLESRLFRLKKLGESETVAIVKGILKQLINIHKNNLVHTNLLPDNIVLELGGECLVPHIVGYGHIQTISKSGLKMTLKQ